MEYLIELKKIYTKLQQSIATQEGKALPTSLLFYLVDKGSETKRYRILMDAAVDVVMVNRDILEQLLHNKYIMLVENRTKFILTVQGIWQAEQLFELCNQDKLLSFIETKYFKFKEVEQELKDKEKIMLLELLLLRAYSVESAVNFKKAPESYNDKVRKITLDIGDFLCSHSVISDTTYKEDLQRTDRKLPAIVHFFRYTETLAKKVSGYYMADSLKYYLNLKSTDADDMTAKLEMLFSRVFGNALTSDVMQEIVNKSTDYAYVQAADLFDRGRHIYATIEYDDIIERSLRRAVRANV